MTNLKILVTGATTEKIGGAVVAQPLENRSDIELNR
jgi:hypothetical protein